MKIIRRAVETGLLIIVLMGLSAKTDVVLAGTYLELEPGVSKKADVDKVLGSPVKEIEKDIRYDYAPQPDTRRISITFDKNTRVIQAIEIYSQEAYSKNQYREWFQLGEPDKTIRDKKGNLVEVYNAAGIMLHFGGTAVSSPIEYFSHFAPSPQDVKGSSVKGSEERSYLEASDKAMKARDWPAAKRLIEEGLRKYPGSADLWHSRALYYFRTPSEPGEIKPREAHLSMERAYQLDPSGKHAAELGWIYRELQRDCRKALPYFEEGVRKGHASKDPTLYYWTGRCSEETGQYDKARTYYDRFLEAAPNHEYSRDARERLRGPAWK